MCSPIAICIDQCALVVHGQIGTNKIGSTKLTFDDSWKIIKYHLAFWSTGMHINWNQAESRDFKLVDYKGGPQR